MYNVKRVSRALVNEELAEEKPLMHPCCCTVLYVSVHINFFYSILNDKDWCLK